MPTVLRTQGFRFFFFSNEGGEPKHVHVSKADAVAKFWLSPISLAWSDGLRSKELTYLRKVVEENQQTLEEKWDEHFGRKA